MSGLSGSTDCLADRGAKKAEGGGKGNSEGEMIARKEGEEE